MSRLWSPHRTHDCTNGIDAERSVGCRLDNDSYLSLKAEKDCQKTGPAKAIK